MPTDPKLQKLKEMMSLLNEGLTRTEFNKSIEGVLKLVVEMEKRNQQAITKLQQDHAAFMENESGNHEMTLADMKKQVNHVFVGERLAEMKQMIEGMVASSMTKMHGKMSEVDKRMMMVKDGYTPQKGKDYFDGKHGNILTPIEVRDKLETLKDGDKLSIQAIEGLTALLEELKVKSSRVVSGGLISKRIRFVDDETPTGTVNGINTIFTLVSKSPETGSLKVYVNGQRMRVTTDYTLSNKTITFVTAPPTGSIILCDYRY